MVSPFDRVFRLPQWGAPAAGHGVTSSFGAFVPKPVTSINLWQGSDIDNDCGLSSRCCLAGPGGGLEGRAGLQARQLAGRVGRWDWSTILPLAGFA